MIFGFLAMTFGGLIEVFYLGSVGRDELAAITFSFPVSMSLNALSRGIGIGASSLIAQAMGERDREKAALITSHCYVLVIVFTLSLSFIGQWLAPFVFSALGATGEVLNLAVTYMRIWLVGFPMMGFAMVSNGMIRAFGNAIYPGYIMTTGPAVQVFLGPLLIFGLLGFPALGLEGAAWTFVIGASCQLLVAAYWFLFGEKLFRPTTRSLSRSAASILHVGIPAAATNLIQPMSAAVVTWLLAGFGVSVVAGFGVASRIEAVVGMVVIGIAASVVPLVGQNWGARLFERVRVALRTCYTACLLWGLIAAIIMWFGAEYFVSVINNDPSLTETAVLFLHIVPFSIGFMGLITVATHSFNALRKPGPALTLSVARLLVVYIPMAMISSYYFGYIAVFVSTAVTNILVGIAAVVWNNRVLKQERRLLG